MFNIIVLYLLHVKILNRHCRGAEGQREEQGDQHLQRCASWGKERVRERQQRNGAFIWSAPPSLLFLLFLV